MKLQYTDETSYILKSALIYFRNERIKRLEDLTEDQYRERSCLRWEIKQINNMLDEHDRQLMQSFVP